MATIDNLFIRTNYTYMRTIASIVCLMALLWCTAPLGAQHRQITQAEYFWNTDPGAGNGIPLVAADGNFDQALETVFANPTALPTPGIHLIGIRVRAANGSWGPVFSQTVEILSLTVTTPNFNITAAEYFWDTDPGQGNGTPLLAFNGNFDEALETAFETTATPTAGFHTLNIRMRDAANNWGPTFGSVVEITNATAATISPIKIWSAEFFWNTDPGQGNGTPLLAINGNFDEALETALASTAVPAIGIHQLHMRVRDHQTWGPTVSAVVEVLPSAPTTIIRSIRIAAAEYFFDNDPGVGNATPMLAFDGNFNSALERIMGGNIPAPVTAGYHTLYMRTQDAANGWGSVYGVVVNIDTTLGFVAQINGPTEACPSALMGVAYSAPAIFGNTYNWSITGGNIATGAGTRNITVNWNTTGSRQLQLIECTANGGLCDTATLIFTMKPNAASSITQTICQGQSYLGYTVAGTYRDTFPAANGCDSIRTLTLTVNPIVRTNINMAICNGQQYHGYTASGTYMDTFVAATGCDSIRTLLLTVQSSFNTTISRTLCFGDSYHGYTTTGTYLDTFAHPSGCDSIRTLYLTILPQITDTVVLALCQGNSYYGHTATGTYADTFSAINGCDSIRILHLTVLPTASHNITTTVCFGGSFAGYSATGIYRDTLVAANGCDSIRTINLTVRPHIATTVSQAICPGQSYLGYSSAGTYVDTFTAVNGCDSIRTLLITIKPVPQATINQTVCYGDSYLGYAQSGTYRDTFTAANGCDSIRILNLTIRPLLTYTQTATICQGNTLQGYSTTGTYVDTFTAANGCDSIRTLILTVLPPITYTSDITACEGDVVAGYVLAGSYIDTFVTAQGCDSIRTLNLTILPQERTLNKVRICPGDSIKLGNTWYFGSGSFNDTTLNANGCNNITTTVLETFTPPAKPTIAKNGTVLSVPAIYITYAWHFNGTAIPGGTQPEITATEAGAYTIKVTNEHNCLATSDEYEWLETGLENVITDWKIRCYPNPTNGTVYLELNGAEAAEVSLFNGLGQLLYQGNLQGAHALGIDLSAYAEGIYYLKARIGKDVVTHKISKTP